MKGHPEKKKERNKILKKRKKGGTNPSEPKSC